MTYPRSSWLQGQVSSNEYLVVAHAADDAMHPRAKPIIEYDRACWAMERGGNVELLKLTPTTCSPKHHVIFVKSWSDTLLPVGGT
mmetsp:Transcript_51352/g.69953  ORF Transcript_51352/g.69953 Transcript_51352/m.69953 type:complete len:85 (+) Transcript_51352:3-257(+)